MIAAWKIAWKGEEVEAAVVAGARGIIVHDSGGIYEVMRTMGDVGNEDREHRVKGTP